MTDNFDYIELPVISGAADGPNAFNWELWYRSVGGRTISIPEADAWLQKIQEQSLRFDGPVAPNTISFDNEIQASDWLKGAARSFGVDEVGVCEIDEGDVYHSREVHEKHAIVLGKKMRYESFTTVPSESAAIECLRIYHDLGEAILKLAEFLRSHGIQCKVEHPIGDSSVMHVPLALKAGFGELGRHGSIIHPTMGPLFRVGCLLTNFKFQSDTPLDIGIGKFCDKCQACRIYCPADAIPDERSAAAGTDPIGNDRYVVDTGKCFPYFATNNYCSACLAVCAYQHKKWATLPDGSVGSFPVVPFGNVPEAVDPIGDNGIHDYSIIRREKPSPFHRNR
ncbi:MAG: hypothetical protein HQ472_09035 [Ignavibacteria bacterium]|nr:hypothetical protein [Ignavibacteria bacterium]